MKKIMLLLGLSIVLIPSNVFAQRGCCSHHGGVVGCSSSGYQACRDGTTSPSCTCKAPVVSGCTDPSALNYNPNANKNNGKCKYRVLGCVDKNAINYNKSANTDDGTCEYKETQLEKTKIDYEIVEKKNPDLYTDEKKVIQEGVVGEKEITYQIIKDKDNVVKSREKIDEKVITNPTDKIVEVGTKKRETKKESSKSSKEENKEDKIEDDANATTGAIGVASLTGVGALAVFVIKKTLLK